jgi:hypothetical protein
LGFAAQFRAQSIEALENAFVFRGRDAGAMVLDPEMKATGARAAARFAVAIRSLDREIETDGYPLA